MQLAAISIGAQDGMLAALATVALVVGFWWAAAAIPAIAGLIGKGIDAAGSGDTPQPYNVDESAFAYAAEPERYRNQGQVAREMVNNYGRSRDYQMEPRNEMLGAIRGYDSQAADLQRMAMEQARQQQMAAVGGVGPSQRAAALRGAGYATAQAQDAISRSGRERLLAEHMAQLQGLGAVRQGDIGASGLDIQDLQARIQRENLARLYEGMGQQDRQFSANLWADSERTNAAAHGAALGAQQQAASRDAAERSDFWNAMGSAGATAAAYGAAYGGDSGTPPPAKPQFYAGGSENSSIEDTLAKVRASRGW